MHCRLQPNSHSSFSPPPLSQILLALLLALTLICIPIQLVCNCLGCAPQQPPQGEGAAGGGGADDATRASGGLTQVCRVGSEDYWICIKQSSAGSHAPVGLVSAMAAARVFNEQLAAACSSPSLAVFLNSPSPSYFRRR